MLITGIVHWQQVLTVVAFISCRPLFAAKSRGTVFLVSVLQAGALDGSLVGRVSAKATWGTNVSRMNFDAAQLFTQSSDHLEEGRCCAATTSAPKQAVAAPRATSLVLRSGRPPFCAGHAQRGGQDQARERPWLTQAGTHRQARVRRGDREEIIQGSIAQSTGSKLRRFSSRVFVTLPCWAVEVHGANVNCRVYLQKPALSGSVPLLSILAGLIYGAVWLLLGGVQSRTVRITSIPRVSCTTIFLVWRGGCQREVTNIRWEELTMTMTMTMTHSEKSNICQVKAWPYRQECRVGGVRKSICPGPLFL